MKLISNQLSPNFTFADSMHAVGQIFCAKKNVYPQYTKIFNTENFLLTNSARTGLTLIIQSLNLPKEKKIGIPAFICAVVATPFLEAGYSIEWLDTDENGLISVPDFEKKSSNISLVVVPHIFGQRAKVEKIYQIVKQNHIFVVEDGAHLFDTDYTHSDAKIFSFGREKVFSCVSGGAVIWNNKKFPVGTRHALSLPKKWWSVRHALQPLIFALALPWWRSGGKCIPAIASQLKILPRAVTRKEKQGHEDFPLASLHSIQQRILLRQFQNAEKTTTHRKKIAEAWKRTLEKLFPDSHIIIPKNYFRVILLTNKKRTEVLARAKHIGFDLNEWNGIPIAPEGVNYEKFGYKSGQCPRAETYAQSYVTFPTNVRTTTRDILRFEKNYPT